MGTRGIYKCRKCGNEFESREGGGFLFIEYRCVKCDWIKSVKSNQMVRPENYKPPAKSQVGKCRKCGGELRDDIPPMCPKCKSRNVRMRKPDVYYD